MDEHHVLNRLEITAREFGFGPCNWRTFVYETERRRYLRDAATTARLLYFQLLNSFPFQSTPDGKGKRYTEKLNANDYIDCSTVDGLSYVFPLSLARSFQRRFFQMEKYYHYQPDEDLYLITGPEILLWAVENAHVDYYFQVLEEQMFNGYGSLLGDFIGVQGTKWLESFKSQVGVYLPYGSPQKKGWDFVPWLRRAAKEIQVKRLERKGDYV